MALSGATTLGQIGPGSDGNEGVFRIPQSSSITETSQSDCLVSKTGHSLVEGSYPSAELQSVYSTAPGHWTITKRNGGSKLCTKNKNNMEFDHPNYTLNINNSTRKNWRKKQDFIRNWFYWRLFKNKKKKRNNKKKKTVLLFSDVRNICRIIFGWRQGRELS